MKALLTFLLLGAHVSAGNVTLQWDPVEFAQGYRLYRAVGTNTVFEFWKQTTATSLTITNTASEPWKIYVTATNGVPGLSSLEESTPSNQVQVNVRPKAANVTVFAAP